VSAHPASHRNGWLSALVAQVSDYVFEDVQDAVEPPSIELEAHPVVAVVAAGRRAGTTTIARLLAAELASRFDGAAVVSATAAPRRLAPPSRAAIRLATGLAGALDAQPLGRICIVATAEREAIVNAGRYLAPIVLDLPPDGSAAGVAEMADRVVVVGGATGEPALLDAVAGVIGSGAWKVVNRVVEPDAWERRADTLVPDSRMAARAAALGTRALGPLGAAIAGLADALEAPR
jgi:hypothetical protein